MGVRVKNLIRVKVLVTNVGNESENRLGEVSITGVSEQQIVSRTRVPSYFYTPRISF